MNEYLIKIISWFKLLFENKKYKKIEAINLLVTSAGFFIMFAAMLFFNIKYSSYLSMYCCYGEKKGENSENLSGDDPQNTSGSTTESEQNKSLSDNKKLWVDISGAVVNPGVYGFSDGDRIINVIEKAGGFDSEASLDFISKYLNLSVGINDEEKIYIPYHWDVDTCDETQIVPLVGGDIMGFSDTDIEGTGVLSTSQSKTTGSSGSKSSGLKDDEDSGKSDKSVKQDEGNANEGNTTSGGKIDVNSASDEQLQSLSGIGPVYSQKIIANRPYKDLAELESKSEIPSGTVQKIADYIVFD